MSQASIVIANGSGSSVRTAINNALAAMASMQSGSSAPSSPATGWLWLDTSDASSPFQYPVKIYDGAQWVTIGTLDVTNHAYTPTGISSATESVSGTAEIATQAELNAGTDDARIATALKLLSWAPAFSTVTVDKVSDSVVVADASDGGKLKKVAASALGTTITAGTDVTTTNASLNTRTTGAHGLGVIPSLMTLELECLTAEHGFSVGDVIRMSEGLNTRDISVVQLRADATNITIETTNNSLPVIAHKTASPPSTANTITAANWRYRVKSWKFT